MEALIQDLRFAARQLRRSPGFTVVVIVTLALGIGANTAMFSVVQAVLLRPLPYVDAGRVVSVRNTSAEGQFTVSERELQVYRGLDDVFEGLGFYHFGSVNLSGEGEAERVRAGVVAFDLLPLLGARPAVGRVTAPEAESEGGPGVAVLSHGLWTRRYGGDPDAVGRRIRIDDEPYTVVGVASPGFHLPLGFAGPPVDVYLPTPYPADPEPRNLHYLHTAGVLAADATLETAERRVTGAAARLKRELGEQLPATFSATVVQAREQAVGEVRASILLLMGAVVLVLLIACINVANLLLARGEGRRRELAVRAALGAGTRRLARQFLTESLLLAGLGGAAGVGLAVAGTRVLVAAAPPGLPRSGQIGLDFSVLAFAAVLTLGVAAAFGLLPVLRAGRRSPRTGLGGEDRGTTVGRSGRRLRWGLVVSEIALATALGVMAVLMSRSALNLGAQDAGFDAERALAFQVSPPDARYPDAASVRAFYDRLLAELRSAPGAVAVGGNSNLPLASTPGDWGVHIRGRGGDEGQSDVGPDWHVTTEGFFRALGIPVVEGRTFGPRDTEDGRQVVVVNRELARRGWPEGDALGGQLRMTTDVDTIWRTVVGVVGDVRHRSLREPPRPAMYLPHAQFPNSSSLAVSELDLVVRTSAEPGAVTSFVRRAVRELDPAVPVSDLRTMETVRRTATVLERFLGALVAGFAALATMLVLVGTYGVLAYLVGRRKREMGVRLSLGASPGGLRSLVVGEGLRMAVLGIGAGVLGALAASRILAGFLYDVSPVDPATYVAVPALLLAVAVAAAWLPARRAARVDPVAVLRAE